MSRTPFPKVESGYPFAELELQQLQRWRDHDVFRLSLERTKNGPEFVFYDGPPTANNVPHVGHVVTRVAKDVIPRYRTMRGDHVTRKAGWDTHGLPVEIEIEKKLGITEKSQIEELGIAEFNKICLESVHKYEQEWRQMVERVGHWIDLEDPYFTYSNTYIESVWWALSELSRKNRLDRGYKIQPYCGRCGTTLSSHEVAQNYKETDDPSIWVLFPTREGRTLVDQAGSSWETGPKLQIVAWTTTPWTLLSHAGLVVNPQLSYRLVRHPTEADTYLLLADGLSQEVPCVRETEAGPERVDLRHLEALAVFDGSTLEGIRYDRPLLVFPPTTTTGEPAEDAPSDENGWLVLPADYVTATEGTGVVHTAPLFGEDDYRTGIRYDLPLFQAVDSTGHVVEGVGLEDVAGKWFKEADSFVLRALASSGRLLHSESHRHSYPFCWRCDEPLLYYATSSWFVRTTLDKEALIENNRRIDWHPDHVGAGRFGDWLENVVDWALSRSRYWGTPLPVWLCDACEECRVIGSFSELFEAADREPPADLYDSDQFDPHRPTIDEFSWPCEKCGGTMRRVAEVIDAWFDSGSMPFAQLHYPFENQELFERSFPADFIAEAVDQTRGWFYTLHVLATLLFDDVAFKHCIVCGHVTDEKGRKMSKRLGNVVDPMEVIADNGADALRLYFCLNDPGLNARFSARLVREAAKSFLLPLWNSLSFLTIYANLDEWSPGMPEADFDTRPSLDRWVLLRLNRCVRETTEHLDGYRIAPASRTIQAFLEELTNWYIRRSRNRFWASTEKADRSEKDSAHKESAYQALYEVLTTLARLLAPFSPFLADILYDRLERSQLDDTEISVHLEAWPEPRPNRRDDALEHSIDVVQRIVRLAHAARNAHGIRTRQPLQRVTLVSADSTLPDALRPYENQVREELNLHEIEWAESRSDYVHHEVVPNFPKCGPRFGKKMPAVKKALQSASGDELVEQLARDQKLVLEVDGESIELAAEEVEVRLIEREGLAVQGDGDLLVALDLQLTPQLISEGLAREVVHRVQNARKEANLDYADRIRVRYQADDELRAAIEEHGDWIQSETLTTTLEVNAESQSNDDRLSLPVEDHDFSFTIERV